MVVWQCSRGLAYLLLAPLPVLFGFTRLDVYKRQVLSFVIVYPAAEFQQLRQASVQKGGGAAAPVSYTHLCRASRAALTHSSVRVSFSQR